MDSFEVITPAGATFAVIGEAERDYYDALASRYQEDNHFTNVSDLQDLDRLLSMELMVWRWAQWVSQEMDYWGGTPDVESLKKSVNEYSRELRLLKKGMGIDKATRDKEKGESFVDYLENLRIRAKEFGVMRETQLDKALILFNELSSLVTLHDNCTLDEQKEQRCEMKDVFEWIRLIAIPEYEAIDEHFRKNSQKYWIRQL